MVRPCIYMWLRGQNYFNWMKWDFQSYIDILSNTLRAVYARKHLLQAWAHGQHRHTMKNHESIEQEGYTLITMWISQKSQCVAGVDVDDAQPSMPPCNNLAPCLPSQPEDACREHFTKPPPAPPFAWPQFDISLRAWDGLTHHRPVVHRSSDLKAEETVAPDLEGGRKSWREKARGVRGVGGGPRRAGMQGIRRWNTRLPHCGFHTVSRLVLAPAGCREYAAK
jgi:hypothetical protein